MDLFQQVLNRSVYQRERCSYFMRYIGEEFELGFINFFFFFTRDRF